MKKGIFSVFLFLSVFTGCSSPNGHEHNYRLVSVNNEADCERPADGYFECDCGAGYGGPYGEALGHDMVYHSEQAATCEEDGWHSYEECSRCGYTPYKDIIYANGHSYTVTEVMASCENDGYTLYECEICGDSYKENEVEAYGHHYISWEAVEPTCHSEGYTSCTFCDVCYYYLEERIEIPRLEHELDIEPGDRATCSKDGWKDAEYCKNCDYHSGHEFEPVLEHNFVDGVCTLCNRVPASEGIIYKVMYDSYAIAVSAGTCTDKDIIIDTNYQGYPVKGISGSLFSEGEYDVNSIYIPDSIEFVDESLYVDNVYIESLEKYTRSGRVHAKNLYVNGELVENLVIPETIEEIGYEAFSGLECLKSVVIGSNIKEISSAAFFDCPNLASVTIEGDLDLVGTSAFANCTSLTEIKFNKVKGFDSGVFDGCTSLASFEFPEGIETANLGNFLANTAIESIEIPSSLLGFNMSGMLSNCSNLRYVDLPDVMSTIPSYIFSGCENLTSIDIPSSVIEIGSGAFYKSGLLSVTLPRQLKTIGDSAFEGCGGLSKIEIPDNVYTIGARAFKGCAGIQKVVIPSNVTKIEEETFALCLTLHSVTFGINVASIGNSAFEGCISLKVIDIPSSVRNIGANAFKSSSLQSATMYGNWNASSNGQSIRVIVTDPTTNAKYLTQTYLGGMWQ